MKRILGLIALFSFLGALEANATSYISCSNGKIDQVGDRHFQIDLLEDGVAFFPYEGSFSLDATELTYAENTFSIFNKTVTITSEGVDYTSRINASLILDEKDQKLNVAISYDKGPFWTYEMTCVTK